MAKFQATKEYKTRTESSKTSRVTISDINNMKVSISFTVFTNKITIGENLITINNFKAISMFYFPFPGGK